MDNISYEIFNRHNEAISRYLELIEVDNIDKLETSLVIISRSIQDINMQISAFEKGEKGVGVYYQLVIKTDILIGAINFLFNYFLNTSGVTVDDSIKNTINEFKLIRSLTIAHPLMTTHYEDFGFGKENDKWCEDILPFSPYMANLSNSNIQADYVLKYKEKNTTLPIKKFITIEEHIIKPIDSILCKLDMITDKLETILEKKVLELRKEPIIADKIMPINDYIVSLKKDLMERYPSEVEVYDLDDFFGEDSEQQNRVDHSILVDVLTRISIKFQDAKQVELYSEYKHKLIEAIYDYGDSIQNMILDQSDAKIVLENLMHPSNDVICKLFDDEQIIYKLSKISYLQHSRKQTLKTVLEKLEIFSDADWRDSNKCSNVEFGFMQLWKLRNKITKYFPIDFKRSDDIVYMQYMLALYYSSNITINLNDANSEQFS